MDFDIPVFPFDFVPGYFPRINFVRNHQFTPTFIQDPPAPQQQDNFFELLRDDNLDDNTGIISSIILIKDPDVVDFDFSIDHLC